MKTGTREAGFREAETRGIPWPSSLLPPDANSVRVARRPLRSTNINEHLRCVRDGVRPEECRSDADEVPVIRGCSTEKTGEVCRSPRPRESCLRSSDTGGPRVAVRLRAGGDIERDDGRDGRVGSAPGLSGAELDPPPPAPDLALQRAFPYSAPRNAICTWSSPPPLRRPRPAGRPLTWASLGPARLLCGAEGSCPRACETWGWLICSRAALQ